MTTPAAPPSTTSPAPPSESLLVLSDLHLGSDLLAHAPEGARRARSREFDEDFVRLLDHYRAEAPPADRWRLVVAGDLFDFIGMALPPDALDTAPNEEELQHGLGNAADHAVAKLRAVVGRHPEVFAAMSRFVADGHGLTIIHGNHDLELHWEPVQAELLSILVSLARAEGRIDGLAFDSDGFLARIELSEWFFYRGGVAYIEHGHQYDPFCATHHVLSPLSPVDPRRLARGFCDVLLRFVVRQTPGLPEHGHEDTGLWYYLTFARRLGLGGALALALRYVRAIRELFRLRRAHLSDAARHVRARHDRAMRRLAVARRISVRKLRRLASLHARPITSTVRGILASLLVDRILLFWGCLAAAVTVVVAASVWEPWAALALPLVPSLWLAGSSLLARSRGNDPAAELARRTEALASLFPAPFIVMGHSHVPTRDEVGPGKATYFNVGSWTDEQPDAKARTHLVIHPGELPVARFLRWDRELGPTEFALTPR